MKGTTEVIKGRLEEAAGALSGNDKLRSKGQTDQAVGHARQAAEKGIRQARASTRKVEDKVRNNVQRAIDRAKNGY